MLCDDIIVVGSSSGDRTLENTHPYPVRVVEDPFENHGKQRVWVLESIITKYDLNVIYLAKKESLGCFEQEKLITSICKKGDEIC